MLTPGFDRKYQHRIGWWAQGLRVRTTTGAAGVPHAVAAVRNVFGKDQLFDTQALNIEAEGARDAIDVLTLALWIFAGVAALAGLVAIGIVVTRDVAFVDLNQATLRALGFTRRQRIAARAPRALLVAGGGALLALLGAIGASPWFPVGVARRADPDPGLHADWTVLAIGIPLLVLLVLAIAFVAALRATRGASFDRAARLSTEIDGRRARRGHRSAPGGDERLANGLPVGRWRHGGARAIRVRGSRRGCRGRRGGHRVRIESRTSRRDASARRLELGRQGRGAHARPVPRPRRSRTRAHEGRRSDRRGVLREHPDRRSSGDRVGLRTREGGHRSRDRGRTRAPRTGRDRARVGDAEGPAQAHRRHGRGDGPEGQPSLRDRRPARAALDRRSATVGRRRVVHERRVRPDPRPERREPDALPRRAARARCRRCRVRASPLAHLSVLPRRRSGSAGRGRPPAPGRLASDRVGRAARRPRVDRRRACAGDRGAASPARAGAVQDRRFRPAAGAGDGRVARDGVGGGGSARRHPDRHRGRKDGLAPGRRQPRCRERGDDSLWSP